MGRRYHRSILGQQIAEILGTAQVSGRSGAESGLISVTARSLLCGGLAFLAMHPGKVDAVSLGELELQSDIGHPLRAVVPMLVGQGEVLSGHCIKIGPGPARLRMPANLKIISPAATRPGEYLLHISTPKPLHEPMYEFSLVIDCPDVPLLERHYSLMLDLAGPPAQTATIGAGNEAQGAKKITLQPALPDKNRGQPRAPQPLPVPGPASSGNRPNILPGTRYRVQKGDTLSEIAKRVVGRPPNSIWTVAEIIFAANRHAFVRNNADLIKRGSLIKTPDADELASLSKGTSAAWRALRASGPQESMPGDGTARQRLSAETTAEPLPVATTAEPLPVATTAEPPPVATTAEPPPVEPAVERPPVSNAIVPEEPVVGDQPPAFTSPFIDELPPNSAFDIGADIEAADRRDTSAVPASDPRGAAPTPSDAVSTLLAIGVGILLGFSLSLLILRGRLLTGIRDLFRFRRQAAPKTAKRKKVRPVRRTESQAQAKAIVSEASEFLDSIAGEAFETNEAYTDNTGVIPVGTPHEDTYIVEVGDAHKDPTLREIEALPEPGESPDIGPVTSVDFDLGTNSELSDDAMLARLFDEPYAQDNDVTDPGLDAMRESPFETDNLTEERSSSEGLEPTAKIPTNDDAEPTAEMPINEDLEPTAQAPISEYLEPAAQAPVHEELEPTAEMPAPAQNEALGTAFETPPAASVDDASEVTMDATGMEASALSPNQSDLEELDPETMFDSAGKIIDSEDARTEQLLAEARTEPGLQAILEDFDPNDNLSGTLNHAMSLLDMEYEDEFTSSQVLEQTAIKKSLAAADEEQSEDEQSAAEPGKINTD